jgi:hypothetical protein
MPFEKASLKIHDLNKVEMSCLLDLTENASVQRNTMAIDANKVIGGRPDPAEPCEML